MSIVTLVSRPGDITFDPVTLDVVTYTPPSAYETGDQNLATSLEPEFDPGTSHGAYGSVYFTAASLSGILASDWTGSDLLDDAPAGSVIVAQRGYVRYSSGYLVGWSMENGDGPSIRIIGGEPIGTDVLSTSSITTPFMTEAARLFIAAEGAPDDTYSVSVSEWWIETDFLFDVDTTEVTEFAIEPPLRIHPRDDTLGTSSAARLFPPPRSYQASNRLGGGYL